VLCQLVKRSLSTSERAWRTPAHLCHSRISPIVLLHATAANHNALFTMAPRRLRDRLNDYLHHKHATPSSSPSKPDLLDPQVSMEHATFEAREASFLPPTKRAKGWPHKSPSPQDLAKAGFFWKPTSSKDNVECFMCGRHLDGWEEEDGALEEHLKHGHDCAWALLMSVEAEREYDTANMEDPTGAQLSEARRNTFETIGWPHESKRGWACKTEKMVEAGWHFAPTTECEDYTCCVYCNLSLDGWEPKDSPFDEHYRRSPDCPFFVFAGTTAPSKRPKKKAGRASKASRTSKASRMSTQSTTMISQADESTGNIEILGEDTSLENAGDNSIISIQSTTSTATKGKRKAPARAKSSTAKKAKTAKSKKKEPGIESQLEEESLPIDEHPPPKKSRSKKKQLEPEPEVHEDMHTVEEQTQPPPKKSRSKKKQPTPEPEPEPELVDEEENEPERRSSGRRKMEATPEPELEVELQVEEDVAEEQPRRRSSRRRTQEPRPEQELEAEVELELDEMQVDQAQPQEEESAAYPTLPGEFPEETPDNFEDAEEEQQAEVESTPQPDTQTMGPPENEGTPIPVKQTSPLKEQTNPPRPSLLEAQVEEHQNKRRSSRRSSAKQRQREPIQEPSASQPSDEENRPPSSLPKEKRPPLSSPGAPAPSWTPIDVETIFQHDANINLFGGVINGTLSETEKDMTVHEWIEHIAEQAESSLSGEGERIVNMFEREGQRALATLEGIQCV